MVKLGRRMGLQWGSISNSSTWVQHLQQAASGFSPSGAGRAPKSALTQTGLPPRPTTTRPLNAGDMDPIHGGDRRARERARGRDQALPMVGGARQAEQGVDRPEPRERGWSGLHRANVLDLINYRTNTLSSRSTASKNAGAI